MKHLLLVLALGLAVTGCTHPKPGRATVRPLSVQQPPPAGLRYPEVIGTYHVGRTVDPDHNSLLHEAHPVFRIEAESQWDLHPGAPGPVVIPASFPTHAAFSPPPVNDAVLAELNHQKEATRQVMQQATQLAETYGHFQAVIADMTAIAREYSLTKEQLRLTEERLRRLEAASAPSDAASLAN